MKNTKTFSWHRFAIAVFFLALVVEVIIGCSGAARVGAGRSHMTVRVAWPKVSRAIPLGAKSIQITLFANEPEFDVKVGEMRVARPEGEEPVSKVTLENLPAQVKLRTRVLAFPNEDGTGTAQAVSEQEIVSGEAGANTDVAIALGSTIFRLEATPSSVFLKPIDFKEVRVTAYNEAGDVVPTDPNSWSWRIQDPEVALAEPNTRNPVAVRPRRAGETTLIGTERDSEKTISIPVTVGAGPPGCTGGRSYGDACKAPFSRYEWAWDCNTGECEFIAPK
ncbi:hypothetical protein [Armatimonas sp.]|uniref:hypothetical protein n=1 Tax=Armatimonas sp. TaxID=1872638 RepID=UPI00286D2B27|nr:hypothetical protein [Armatimonas sp.]